jgi:hypothetical protein
MNQTTALAHAPQVSTGLAPVARGGETAAAVLAEQAKALVAARYMIAYQNPRDIDVVRERMLKAARRPLFAESARYRVKRGKKQDERGRWVDNIVEGPSIRFAEEALRALGNVDVSTTVVFEDETRRELRVRVTDLEANYTSEAPIVVTKRVERSSLRDGQTAISSRTNSEGKTTYLVEASEDDLANKIAALTSKALRGLALRMVPSDLVEEALIVCDETRKKEDKVNPDAARKKLADAFGRLGVGADDLAEYLGKPFAKASPDDLDELRAVGTAIKEKETSWAEALASKLGTEAPAAPAAKAASKAAEKLAAAVTDKRARGKEGERDPKPENVPTEAATPAKEKEEPKPLNPLDCSHRKEGDVFEFKGDKYTVIRTPMGLVAELQGDGQTATQDAPPEREPGVD